MSYERVREVWLRCEELGFDSVWLYDHLVSVSSQNPFDVNLEGWTLLSSLAPQTDSIKVGILVLCNNFRHPPLLAKMSSTLDVLTGGRLIVGIGAGWNDKEHSQYGLPFPRTGERLSRLEEAIEIIRLMWTNEESTFHGKYYTIDRAINSPRPKQKPHPPVLVGSLNGGEKIARIAAIHADIYNTFATGLEDYKQKMLRFDSQVKKHRRDRRPVQRTITSWPTLIRSKSEVTEELSRRARKKGVSIRDYEVGTKDQLFGTPEMCAEALRMYERAGLDGIIFGYSGSNSIEHLNMLVEVAQQFS